MNKFKAFFQKNQDLIRVFLGTFFITLALFGAFSAWRASWPAPFKVESLPIELLKSTSAPNTADQLLIIGNRRSKIYHFDFCPGAQRMKPENKVYFASIDEAQAAGYRPAKNCPGLK